MNLRPENIFYQPWGGWIASGRQIHFNKDVLCEGEPLKILATRRRGEWALNSSTAPVLSIHSLNEDVEKQSVVIEKELIDADGRLVQVVGTGVEEPLTAGAYIAQVSAREDEAWPTAEHYFVVVPKDEYYEELKEFFGTEWDASIYADQMERSQGEELMRGLPVEDLVVALPDDFTWNGETVLRMVGPVAASLMADAAGNLPGFFSFSNTRDATSIPHIDLTKLIWTLNALSSSVRDFVFYNTWTTVSTVMNAETLDLNISNDSPFLFNRMHFHDTGLGLMTHSPDREWPVSVLTMYEFIKNTLGESLKAKLTVTSEQSLSIRFS